MKSNFEKYLNRTLCAVGLTHMASSFIRDVVPTSDSFLSVTWASMNAIGAVTTLAMAYRVLRKGVE